MCLIVAVYVLYVPYCQNLALPVLSVPYCLICALLLLSTGEGDVSAQSLLSHTFLLSSLEVSDTKVYEPSIRPGVDHVVKVCV